MREHADQYLRDYRDLVQISPDSPASYLLLFRVIELELKAWHRQGNRQRPLGDTFRHDLMASYVALPAKHRILLAEEVGLLALASKSYSKQGVQGRMDLVALEVLAEKVMAYGDGMELAEE
jgi:hypothetical protein